MRELFGYAVVFCIVIGAGMIFGRDYGDALGLGLAGLALFAIIAGPIWVVGEIRYRRELRRLAMNFLDTMRERDDVVDSTDRLGPHRE